MDEGWGEGRAPARLRLEQGMVRIKPLPKERISADFGIYFARHGIYINKE